MPLTLSSLGSGSAGNCSYIGDGASGLLLDAGFSGKKVLERMKACGLDPASIKGIVISHEHGDHCKGAGALSRRLNVPIFANEMTMERIEPALGKTFSNIRFNNGENFEVGGIEVTPFPIPHDAVDPCAFLFRTGKGQSLAYVTDTGVATTLVHARMKGADYIVLEANHDVDTLKAGPYPWELKQRILSNTGHLSNEACMELLSGLLHSGLQGVTFAHLSEKNNSPYLVDIMAKKTLESKKIPFIIASQERATPVTIVE